MNQLKDLGPANWTSLETVLRETGRSTDLCGSFMWMWRQNGVEFYKHVDTRRYLLLDSERRCWRQGNSGLELSDFDCEFRRVTEAPMKTKETAQVVAGEDQRSGRSIGDISAERIDNVWRPEDHEAVMRNLRAADRLATQVVGSASAKAAERFQTTIETTYLARAWAARRA